MTNRRKVPLDAETLAEVILAQCLQPEDGGLGELLREAQRQGGAAAREALLRPDVRLALALRISATHEAAHAQTAALLRTLRQLDAEATHSIVAECDVPALARSLSYVTDYTAQQASVLARLYQCNAEVGARVFARCGALLKDFLAQSLFPYLDLPEDLIADVEHWRKGG